MSIADLDPFSCSVNIDNRPAYDRVYAADPLSTWTSKLGAPLKSIPFSKSRYGPRRSA